MRVLLVSQFFPPETGGTSNRLRSFARELQRAGHEITVVCEKPNHPEGVIWEEYRGGAFNRRQVDGVEVVHTWVFTRPTKNFVTRIAFYLSFMAMAVLAAPRLEDSYDVTVASSPPLFVGVAGWVLSRLKGAPFVLDVRDLWPDLAVAMGEIGNPFVVWLAERLEHFLYRRADGITTATDGFRREINRKTGGDIPVVRVSNATEPERFRVEETRSTLRSGLDLPDGFLVTYAGNVGICQGLDHVVDAAEALAGERPRVRFLFLGEGPAKDALVERVRAEGLENVLFCPRVPLDRAARFMAASDALLVPLADHPIFKMFVPSKLYDSMAAGRPVLLSVDGEARHVMEEARAGLFYPPEDGEALARRVVELQDDPDREAMGERGRRYVAQHFTREEQALRMIDFLETTARGDHSTSPIESPPAGGRDG